MMQRLWIGVLATLGAATAGAQAPNVHGSVIEHDSTVATEEPGTHGGGGMSTGYSFFKGAPGLTMVFRKRALHPGAGIGYHEQKEDEIYYVLSGRGEFTLDGEKREVGPGTAMLTRPGSSHAIRTLGDRDLVLLIAYQTQPKAPKP
ncbi:MAG: cupin domain-containing protein [Gemmatirosa sp.]|nr:cupin domain-containing protein [Gemmatirosa sp.]